MKGSIGKQAMAEVPGILANFLELPEKDVIAVTQQGDIDLDFLVKASANGLTSNFGTQGFAW